MAYEVFSRKSDPFGKRGGDTVSEGSPSWMPAESVISADSVRQVQSAPPAQNQSLGSQTRDNNQIIKLAMVFPPIGVVTHG